MLPSKTYYYYLFIYLLIIKFSPNIITIGFFGCNNAQLPRIQFSTWSQCQGSYSIPSISALPYNEREEEE